MRVAVAVVVVVLAGCASPSGSGRAIAVSSSPGAVVVEDLTIIKQFGAGCSEASSGLATTTDAQSEQGGDLGVNVATQTGSLGVSAGAALVSSLAALDTCGPQDETPEVPDESEGS